MGESDINARSSIIIFFILAVGFSLTYAGIFRDNTAIGIVAYAKKSESSGGSSDSGEGSSSDSSGSSSAVSSSTGSDNNPPKGEPSLKPENPQSSPPAPPKEEATPTPTPTPCSQAALAMPCPPPPPPPPPPGPDESCLFHPEQDKCKPDPNGNCPNGFFLNDDEHCVPDKLCPKGFEHHFEDETGACYPINKPTCSSGFHIQMELVQGIL